MRHGMSCSASPSVGRVSAARAAQLTELVRLGKTVREIAEETGLMDSTIYTYLSTLGLSAAFDPAETYRRKRTFRTYRGATGFYDVD